MYAKDDGEWKLEIQKSLLKEINHTIISETNPIQIELFILFFVLEKKILAQSNKSSDD